MRTLPVHIDEDQISEMFHVADKDGDGKLGFEVRFIIIQCFKNRHMCSRIHISLKGCDLLKMKNPS